VLALWAHVEMVTASNPSQVNTVGCARLTSSLIAKTLCLNIYIYIYDEPIMHNKAINDILRK